MGLVLVRILVIAVLIAVAVSFIPPAQTWRHVATFSGAEPQGTFETGTFDVTGSMFRMSRSVREADCVDVPEICNRGPPPGGGPNHGEHGHGPTTLQFRLFEAGTTSAPIADWIVGPEFGNAAFGGTYEIGPLCPCLQGGGSFYLHVFGGDWVDSWSLVIEEWK